MRDEPRSGGRRRREYLLDPRWQLSVFRNIAGVALAAGLIQVVGTYFVSSQDPLERWSGQQIALLALAFNCMFFGLIFLALWMVSVRITHSVVGPANLIKQAVEGLAVGDFDRRLALRKRDYLKELASSVKELSDHMRERATAADELSRQLVEALERKDLERALELAERLRSSPAGAEGGESKCAA